MGGVLNRQMGLSLLNLCGRVAFFTRFTHRHFDHTGGRLPAGMTGGRKVVLEGLAEVAAKGPNIEVMHYNDEYTA